MITMKKRKMRRKRVQTFLSYHWCCSRLCQTEWHQSALHERAMEVLDIFAERPHYREVKEIESQPDQVLSFDQILPLTMPIIGNTSNQNLTGSILIKTQLKNLRFSLLVNKSTVFTCRKFLEPPTVFAYVSFVSC